MSWISKFKWGSFLGNLAIGALGGGGGLQIGNAIGGPTGAVIGATLGSLATSGFSFGQPSDEASALGQMVGADAIKKLTQPQPDMSGLGSDLTKLALQMGLQQLALQAQAGAAAPAQTSPMSNIPVNVPKPAPSAPIARSVAPIAPVLEAQSDDQVSAADSATAPRIGASPLG